MPSRLRHLFFLAVLLPLCVGCAPAFEERFPEQYDRYLAQPEHKALAYVHDRNGAYAYGYRSGKETKQAAIEGALEQCQVRQELYQVLGDCEIYMVNDRKVEE